tara:strand:- start:656 stop:1651 length:996 start_codon:yes stop_codon:yes gene_type:complete
MNLLKDLVSTKSCSSQFKLIVQLLITLFALLGGHVVSAAQDEITYFHYDALGSPVLATDESGAVKWREQYAPYGARLLEESRELDCSVFPCEPTNSPWENRQFYTGKYDEADIGLTYFGARWYDPSLGRFLSVDPVDFTEDNIFSFNQYAYGNNNPYRYADPDGNSPVDVLFLAADVAKLGVAIYTGDGVGAAAADVGLSLIGTVAPVPGLGQALKAGKVARSVTKYEVGTFSDLSRRSKVGDKLDIHHVPQKHPAGQSIDGYDPKTGPSIAIPSGEHRRIPTIKGQYRGSARDLLAKDIKDLRNHTNAPNSALQDLVRRNREANPGAFNK